MTIEFLTPIGEVHEWVIDDIKKKLTEFHQRDKDISRAQVYFRKNPKAFDGDFVCEIELTIFGNSVMVQRNADSYLLAEREVMKELPRIVDEQIHQQNEPSDEILSTVKV